MADSALRVSWLGPAVLLKQDQQTARHKEEWKRAREIKSGESACSGCCLESPQP